MSELAPGLAYYGMLSLFPALLLTFTVLRFVAGPTAASDIAAYAQQHGLSGPLAETLRSAVDTARHARAPAAGAAGLAGLATLVYGTSRAYTATGRALDQIVRRAPAPRPWRRRAADLVWSLALFAVVLVAVLALSLSGRVLDDVLGLLGLSGSGAAAWRALRWPLAAVLLTVVVALVRWTAPSERRTAFRLLSAGIAVSVAGIMVASAGFSLYVGRFGSYNAIYGAFAGAVILMLWIWLAGSVFLLGAELDAVLEERRRVDVPASRDALRG